MFKIETPTPSTTAETRTAKRSAYPRWLFASAFIFLNCAVKYFMAFLFLYIRLSLRIKYDALQRDIIQNCAVRPIYRDGQKINITAVCADADGSQSKRPVELGRLV